MRTTEVAQKDRSGHAPLADNPQKYLLAVYLVTRAISNRSDGDGGIRKEDNVVLRATRALIFSGFCIALQHYSYLLGKLT